MIPGRRASGGRWYHGGMQSPNDAAEAWFRTRYEARDDAAHLALYAPDAFVVVGDRAVRRAEADDAAVLAAWGEVKGNPHFVAPKAGAWRPEGEDRGLLDVAVLEASEERDWKARFGLVKGPDGWKVAFAWLPAARDVGRTWEAARAAALSELASLRPMTILGPLTSLLEVSWARQARLPRQRLLTLPETRFSCAGTGACCSHDLTIGIEDNARAFLEAVDWGAAIAHAPAGPFTEALPEAASGLVAFRHKLSRQDDGRCKFLTPDNKCAIHALVGRAVFKPCHVFPYRFALTPDGVAVTTNAMCPTARACRGLGLAEQEGEVRTRLAVADVLRADKYYLRPGEEVPWEVFKTVEGQLLELLKGEAPATEGRRGDLSIKRKLWVALRWLQARVESPSAGVHVKWYDERADRLGWLARMAFKRFPTLFDLCFKDLEGVEPGEGIWPEHEAELERFFRSFLFSKALTYPYGLVAGLNYAALVLAVLERQIQLHGSRGLSEAFWREFYAVVTAGTFLPILQVLHQRPATGFARQASDPRFGMGLLRLHEAVPAGPPPTRPT